MKIEENTKLDKKALNQNPIFVFFALFTCADNQPTNFNEHD